MWDLRDLRKTGASGFVFGREDGRTFAPSSVVLRAETAWAAAGLTPIGLHECRHTFASFMIAAGVNAKALSTYMGHASVTITFDRYGHLMPGNDAEAARLLDRYLEAHAKRPRRKEA
jgi:integrase